MRFDNDETRLPAVRGFAYLFEDRNRWEVFLAAAEQEAPALWSFLQAAAEAYSQFWETFDTVDSFAPEQIIAELQAVLTHVMAPEPSRTQFI